MGDNWDAGAELSLDPYKRDKTEVRVKDPNSGGEKGTKLARFSLVPREFLWALAEHYGRGARKYNKYGECSCVLIARNLEDYIQDNVAETVTKSGSGLTIPNMQNVNAEIDVSGVASTQIGSRGITRTTVVDQGVSEEDLLGNIDLLLGNTTTLYPSLADFVGNQKNLDTLIIILRLVRSGALSATAAILELDSLKSAVLPGQPKHWPGCKALEIIESGDRNWERGYKWSYSVDALERHLNQWLLGEDIDEETGSHHLIAVAWHAAALFIFQLRRIGTNDVTVGRASYKSESQRS